MAFALALALGAGGATVVALQDDEHSVLRTPSGVL
jgi:hypothetical protein